jgi:hypothetical protein
MNEIMLEETRDTITVPATLMIRMLGTIHILRKHFFVKRKEFLFQYYVLKHFPCRSLNFLVFKEENNC